MAHQRDVVQLQYAISRFLIGYTRLRLTMEKLHILPKLRRGLKSQQSTLRHWNSQVCNRHRQWRSTAQDPHRHDRFRTYPSLCHNKRNTRDHTTRKQSPNPNVAPFKFLGALQGQPEEQAPNGKDERDGTKPINPRKLLEESERTMGQRDVHVDRDE